jgi:hypothetical protein
MRSLRMGARAGGRSSFPDPFGVTPVERSIRHEVAVRRLVAPTSTALKDFLEWHVVGSRPDTPSPATVRRVSNVRSATAVEFGRHGFS